MAAVFDEDLGGDVVRIFIGPEQVRFNIHEQRLRTKTAFFILHPRPHQRMVFRIPAGPAPTESDARSSMDIDSSDSNEERERPPSPSTQGSDKTIVPTTEEMTDMTYNDNDNDTDSSHSAVVIIEYSVQTLDFYHLLAARRPAFKVLCEWLYYGQPRVPTNLAQCKTMVDTYLLATRYRAQGLPDLIMDGMREYHRIHTIQFALLGYTLQRHDDESGLQQGEAVEGASPALLNDPMRCRMITYLVHQADAAMRAEWGGSKLANQDDLSAFWTSRHDLAKYSLFEAMAKMGPDNDSAHGGGRQQEYYVAPRPAAPPAVAAPARRAKAPRAR